MHHLTNGMETDGDPFRVPDLWQKSTFTLSDAPEETLFSDIRPELSLISHDFTASLRLPDLETFQFAKLEDIPNPEVSNAEGSIDECGPDESDTQDDDVWRLDDALPKAGQLRTWEAFANEHHAEPRITYISEAGPRAFDALQDGSSNVLQSGFFLKCLAMLGLGRSSALFQWSSKNTKFVPTLDDIRLSGFSLKSSTSLVSQLSVTGSAFVQLRGFVDKSYSVKRPLAARIALATCIQVVLEALDQNLAENVFAAPTALQLLAHFDVPGQILGEMRALVEASAHENTDVAFLSAIRQELERLDHACSPFHKVHLDILNRVAQPWIDKICRDTGLLHSERGASVDASILEQSLSKNDGLISSKDAERILETTNGLNILQTASPDHPLLLPASWGIEQPRLDRPFMHVHAGQVLEKAKEYQKDLLEAIASYEKGSQHPQAMTSLPDIQDQALEQLPWQLDQGQQEYFEMIGTQFSKPPLQNSDAIPSHLRSTVSTLLGLNGLSQEDGMDIQNNEVTPLQHLQPYLSAQNQLVNGSILRLLFRQFDLRKHLNLQHSFHLFGNGIFVHRLTTALFSSEAHSAERKRGQIIGGVNLGLRLDSRETRKWPPASSELRLGLMGVLTDAWASPEELPGGLSFSIRELDDAEIEKVLDPHGIHALDFLRLRYEAPAPLDVILTSESMQKYDGVFRVLLRILRMAHVVTHLRRSATAKTSTPAIQAFAHDAHHAINAISSHMFDTGITSPWQHFNSRLDTLQSDLDIEDTSEGGYGSRVTLGTYGLRALHDEMLDTMRSRLFLRTRHLRLKEAVESILNTVLDVQNLVTEHGFRLPEQQIWESRDRLREQIKALLDQLTDLGRKLARRTAAAETDRDDAVAADMLRWKLDPGMKLGDTSKAV